MEQLSNYELLDLYTTYTSDGAGHFMNFLAVFSAYLVAGYFVGGKLSRPFLIALSLLYMAVVAMTAIGNYTAISTALDLAGEIARRDFSDAINLAGNAASMSGTAGELVLIFNPLIQVVACLGSIAFVFNKTTHGEHCTPVAIAVY